MANNDDAFAFQETLMLMLITATPPVVLRAIAQRLREEVSIECGDAAEDILTGGHEFAPYIDGILTRLHAQIVPIRYRGVRAPESGHTVEEALALVGEGPLSEPTTIGIQNRRGGWYFAAHDVRPLPASAMQELSREPRYVEAKAGCECPYCAEVLRLQGDGVRVDARTGYQVGPHHEN